MMERQKQTPADSHQERLLQQFCTEAEEAIAQAGSLSQARASVELICVKLERECMSDLVVHAARQHIQTILQQKWENL